MRTVLPVVKCASSRWAKEVYATAYCLNSADINDHFAEINAATSTSALIFSDAFNLTTTYFLIAGIAGVNPHVTTTGSVNFARYAVQLDLQMEFDSRQIPSNDTSGYFPQNANFPDETNAIDYPDSIYGTEVLSSTTT